MKKILHATSLVFLPSSFKRWIYGGNIMLYRISVTERGLTGIANIFRSRLSRLDDLLGAGTVPLSMVSFGSFVFVFWSIANGSNKWGWIAYWPFHEKRLGTYRVFGLNLTLFVFIISPSSCKISTSGNVCLLASLFVFQRWKYNWVYVSETNRNIAKCEHAT